MKDYPQKTLQRLFRNKEIHQKRITGSPKLQHPSKSEQASEPFINTCSPFRSGKTIIVTEYSHRQKENSWHITLLQVLVVGHRCHKVT